MNTKAFRKNIKNKISAFAEKDPEHSQISKSTFSIPADRRERSISSGRIGAQLALTLSILRDSLE
jgi:hypothetical protein